MVRGVMMAIGAITIEVMMKDTGAMNEAIMTEVVAITGING
jgi:hypothetical protein